MFKNMFIGKFDYKYDNKSLYNNVKVFIENKGIDYNEELIYDLKCNGDYFSFKYCYITNHKIDMYKNNTDELGKYITNKSDHNVFIYYNHNNICIDVKSAIDMKQIIDYLYRQLDINVYSDYNILSHENFIKKLRSYKLNYIISQLTFKNVKIAGVKTKSLTVDTYDSNDAFILINKINTSVDEYKVDILDEKENKLSIDIKTRLGIVNINYSSICEELLEIIETLIEEVLYEGD
ncbi:Uncharacterised protein [[Clostridium] sordellii]|uniref:hypothetical protein n=1 Tax=Paraclostridium sordellii TaxID=1505 RepID=UPI0005E1C741|nr:hypothetical protein [Paeniclostridium sordellii]MBX9179953.1 hypothetical protein [Paeniclostridium sordellii]CEO11364.1 Uncharacterised protein [[Clostridium] sordellii] [Paeniclostridium sordellii]